VAFVGPVVAKSAPLARQGTNKFCIGDASCLKSLPKKGTPASLRMLEMLGLGYRTWSECEAYWTASDGISEGHNADLVRRLTIGTRHQSEYDTEEGEQKARSRHTDAWFQQQTAAN
jgi:hypothetical protein